HCHPNTQDTHSFPTRRSSDLQATSKKRKVWLTSDQVNKMTRLAADNNKRDHLLLLLMRYGLRCGEIVGWRGLPGIRIGDIRDEGIWVKGKGYARGIVQDRLVPVPRDLIRQLRDYIARTLVSHFNEQNEDKVFPIYEVRAEQI